MLSGSGSWKEGRHVRSILEKVEKSIAATDQGGAAVLAYHQIHSSLYVVAYNSKGRLMWCVISLKDSGCITNTILRDSCGQLYCS